MKNMSKKKKIILAVIIVLALGAIGSLFQDEDDKTGNQDKAQTEVSTQEAEKKDPETEVPDTETEENSTEKQENDTESAENSTESVSGNPLVAAELQVGDVMNGTRTDKIGEYAYIEISREKMKNVTIEQYAEFCSEVVKDSGYNWVTIDFGDGFGIQFQGSIPSISSYGSLDTERCITEQVGTIMMTGDNTYEYTES